MKNQDGSWTLSDSELDNLEMTSPTELSNTDNIQALISMTDSVTGDVSLAIDSDTILGNLTDNEIDLTDIINNIPKPDSINLEDNQASLLNVNLDDVIDLIDNDNDLVIKGDDGDTINLSENSDDNNDWIRSENSTIIDGQDFTEYTNSTSPLISVFIDNDIDLDTTGLN
jgi:hypothetical protein